MKRFWVSWIQLTKDYRPLTDPPTEEVCGWWVSGYNADDLPILCAVIDAGSENAATAVVYKNWQSEPAYVREVGAFRFCSEKELNWTPGDRFPITEDWQRERLNK